jgi:hypothetical protein
MQLLTALLMRFAGLFSTEQTDHGRPVLWRWNRQLSSQSSRMDSE